MSGSFSSPLRGGVGGGLGATTVLAAKVALASAALAAAASLARAAVPQIVSGAADAFLWKLYLFVAVHVIIFVIWKLSDGKHFHAAAAQQHKEDPWAPTPHHPAPPLLQTEEVALSAVKRKVDFVPAAAVVVRDVEYCRVPPPVSRPHPHVEAAASKWDEGVVSPGSGGGESCVTTESEEEAASSAVAPAVSSRSVAPAPVPVRERAVVERGISLPLPPPPAVATSAEYFNGADLDDGGDDDLDATWNAIMQRTRPATAPALTSSSARAPRF